MRVLIATASKHAGTAEIAARIGRVIGEHGHDVRVEEAAEVHTVDDVDAVLLQRRVRRALAAGSSASRRPLRDRAARPTGLALLQRP